jgi:L-idonate 5-dehydrogenase
MKAVVVHGARDLRIEEVGMPSLKPGEVLVRMEWGGICGSDLGYWKSGVSGTNVMSHPFVLGHEVAGRVEALGPGAQELTTAVIGDGVAVHPAKLVGYAGSAVRDDGRFNLHTQVEHLGSAAFAPHTDGGFCSFQAIAAQQLRVLPGNVTTRQGALAEPLGVAIHAVKRAGNLKGRTVLVNGCGPIGALVTAVAKAAGAATVIAADLFPDTLAIAAAMGADEVRNLSLDSLPEDVDVSFEASGAPAAIGAVIGATARGGILVQVGNLPTSGIQVSLGNLVTREIDYRGSYRFVDEISDAVRLLADGLDVSPIMTHEFAIDDALKAFETAADRSTGSSKVLLKLS